MNGHRYVCAQCGSRIDRRSTKCLHCYRNAVGRIALVKLNPTKAARYVYALSVAVLRRNGFTHATCEPSALSVGQYTETREGDRIVLWWKETEPAKEAA